MRNTIKEILLITSLTLAAAFCFWQGLSSPEAAIPASIVTTPVSYVPPVESQIVAQPIETIRVGQRVWIGENPSSERDARIGAEIDDPQQWRKMVLRCPKRDGSTAEVEMLRPVWWLEEQNVHPGGKAEINVPECGIEGLADVLDVRPCPPIQSGQGRVVTATFHHQAAQIIDVAIEGLTEPIGSTPNHPFWSETKHEFVRADQLRPGEEVRTADSTAQVTSIATRGPPEPVYNLEVQFEHVYRVGDSGVLVHNGTPENCFDYARRGRDAHGGQVVRIDSPAPGRGKVDVPGYDEGQFEHAVRVKGGKMFDPLHRDGVPARQYFEDVRDLNGYKSLRETREKLGIGKID